jgi:hypothetical protein
MTSDPKWWEIEADDDVEDFDSDDFTVEVEDDLRAAREGSRNAYIGGLWSRYGYGSSAMDQRMAVVTAHEMVQTFIDTFRTTERDYRVTFDPRVGTAGTDLNGFRVVVTPAPVYDKSITPEEAGIILTGMAVHEVSHVRYGRSTAAAVTRTFGKKPLAQVISNLLDDVRIERRFADEYPGYRDVFLPMLDYVAQAAIKVNGPPVPRTDDPVNLAISAVRYARWAVWTPEASVERDWWQAWADRWSREDAPRRHVAGVREALRHIAAQRKAQEKPKASLSLRRSGLHLDEANDLEREVLKRVSSGKRGREIAVELNMPEKMVRETLARARRKITTVTL